MKKQRRTDNIRYKIAEATGLLSVYLLGVVTGYTQEPELIKMIALILA
jgi:hypothetical protein